MRIFKDIQQLVKAHQVANQRGDINIDIRAKSDEGKQLEGKEKGKGKLIDYPHESGDFVSADSHQGTPSRG